MIRRQQPSVRSRPSISPQPMRESLGASVLVLNRFYVAVHVAGVRRSMSLLCRDLAEVVHMEDGQFSNYDFDSWRLASELMSVERHPDDDWIRSVKFEIQVPKIIRLLFYERVPKQQLRFNRRNLFARDGNCCQYCCRTFPHSQLSLDHVIPRSRGGQTTWENVVCCCVNCNVKKGGRTPREARMKLATNPVRPKYSPLLVSKLENPKYESWRTFLPAAMKVKNV